MDPKNAHAWHNKGEVLSSTTSARGLFINNQDRYDAIDCFKKVIELDLNNAAKAWLCIAKVLAGLNIKKNSNDIIMCCDAALDNQIPSQIFHSETGESFPHQLYAYLQKATVFFALEKYKETFECCDKVLETTPKEKAIWEMKAYAARKLKKHEEALKCYEKILELDPENYGAQYEAKKEREYISKH
jgi:tetratricopeptide (TPR) repeat protein